MRANHIWNCAHRLIRVRLLFRGRLEQRAAGRNRIAREPAHTVEEESGSTPFQFSTGGL